MKGSCNEGWADCRSSCNPLLTEWLLLLHVLALEDPFLAHFLVPGVQVNFCICGELSVLALIREVVHKDAVPAAEQHAQDALPKVARHSERLWPVAACSAWRPPHRTEPGHTRRSALARRPEACYRDAASLAVPSDLGMPLLKKVCCVEGMQAGHNPAGSRMSTCHSLRAKWSPQRAKCSLPQREWQLGLGSTFLIFFFFLRSGACFLSPCCGELCAWALVLDFWFFRVGFSYTVCGIMVSDI